MAICICCNDEGCCSKDELCSCECFFGLFCGCCFDADKDSLDTGLCTSTTCSSCQTGDWCLCEDEEGVDKCCACCEGCGPCLATFASACFSIWCCFLIGVKREKKKKLTGQDFSSQRREEREMATEEWSRKRAVRAERKKLERRRKSSVFTDEASSVTNNNNHGTDVAVVTKNTNNSLVVVGPQRSADYAYSPQSSSNTVNDGTAHHLCHTNSASHYHTAYPQEGMGERMPSDAGPYQYRDRKNNDATAAPPPNFIPDDG